MSAETCSASALRPVLHRRAATRAAPGLGLHIVYNLVTQQLGGRLTLESRPGRAHDSASPSRGSRRRRRHRAQPAQAGDRAHGRQDDILHLDRGHRRRAAARCGAALEGRGHRRRAGGARRHALRARPTTSLNGQGIEILSAYSAAEGRELMRKHPDMAVVLLDVIMETDAAGLQPCRIHPQRAQERDRPHHPAHRPAGTGAGAARHRRLRHQRLQGEDRAHRRQAVHLADRGAAQLPATPAHGARPAAGSRSSSTPPRRCSISSRCSGWRRAC